MNKSILIASAVSLGAAVLFYFIKRNRRTPGDSEAPVPVHHSHHLTDVFAKAKKRVTSHHTG